MTKGGCVCKFTVTRLPRGVYQRRCQNLQEELGVAADDGLEQCVAIGGGLGDGLAERKRVNLAHVPGQVEVVSSDGSSNGRAASADGIQGGGSGAVLEDDAEVGELLVEPLQGGQEGLLVRLALGDDAGDLTVEVQDHVVLLHGGEGGVEVVERGDTGLGVCGDAFIGEPLVSKAIERGSSME